MHLPEEDAEPVLLVVLVLAFVALAIGPDQLTVSVHFVVGPHPVVAAPVAPLIPALAFDVVHHKLPFVFVAIGPGERAHTLLDALLVCALELAAVGPALNSAPVLSVILPEAAVQGAILVVVEADAVGLVVEPLTLVNVAVFVQKSPIKVGLIILPVALVEAAIGPYLHTAALSSVGLLAPFTHIYGAVLKEHSIARISLFEAHMALTFLAQELKGPISHQHPLKSYSQF